MVLMHKGMWDLRNDDLPGSARRIDSPYDLITIGVYIAVIGVSGEVGITFGLTAGLWTGIAAAVIIAAISAIRLKRIDKDDKDARIHAAVSIIVSVFAILVAGLMLFLI